MQQDFKTFDEQDNYKENTTSEEKVQEQTVQEIDPVLYLKKLEKTQKTVQKTKAPKLKIKI